MAADRRFIRMSRGVLLVASNLGACATQTAAAVLSWHSTTCCGGAKAGAALYALPMLALGAVLPTPWLVTGGLVAGAGSAVTGTEIPA